MRDLLRQEGRLDAERAVALMRDICAGVGVAHRQGIVHRDLKPDNVIVVPPDADGEPERAKVLDFGLAKLRDNAELSLTQTGAVMGTPYYMSPEQWRGESLDARADVYSLGAMLYEMLTASPPFDSTSAAGLMVKHLNEALPPLEPNLQISPALETVCRRALSKTPEERQADAAVLSRELQAALAAPPITEPCAPLGELQSISPVPSTPSQWGAPQGQRPNRVKWIAAAGLLTLLVAAVIAVMAIRYLRKDKVTNHNAATSTTTEGNIGVAPNVPPNAPSNRATEDEASSTGAQDLTGTWIGTYGPLGTPATLVIKEHKGGKWSGHLEQGSARVGFIGSIEVSSRKVTFKETEVISGDGWSLGDNTGVLSPDGRKMSGTGKDAVGAQLGISYDWSFSKR